MGNITSAKFIPAFDLTRQFFSLRKEIEEALRRVFQGGNFILGEELKNFEEEFARYVGVRYAFGVASGTDALTIALKALDVNADDEVIIPANAYPLAFAVARVRAQIVLCDVDPQTFLADAERIGKRMTRRTKVIIPVHLYGLAVDLEPIIKLARARNVYVIEDASHAHGASYKGRKVGSLAHFGCFSFYPTKNLGAYGDAGAIVTNSKRLAHQVNLLRTYGEVKRYESIVQGFNSRLDEVQAAMLRVKLRYLDRLNRKRRSIAEIYRNNLSPLSLILPSEMPYGTHVYHQYVIRTTERDRFKKFLAKHGIETLIHYPSPIHFQKSFRGLGERGSFPAAERLSREVLSLPMFPELTDGEVRRVCQAVKRFYAMK